MIYFFTISCKKNSIFFFIHKGIVELVGTVPELLEQFSSETEKMYLEV